MSRTAIVLFNLGGPDRPEAVRPFLFNLFNDPAIIGAPGPVRFLLAKFISARREKTAREMYDRLGGGSPLLPNTEAQARALEAALGDGQTRAFVCMRYWHPRADAVAAAVKAFDPERVVLLPLYPQFSTTTTASSLREWENAAARVGLRAPTRAVCCYPTEPGFVAAVAQLTAEAIAAAGPRARVLFSAHGLPKKVDASGDPYAWQVEQGAAAIAGKLGLQDWVVCYQSRVGPLEWLKPYTEEEILRAGRDRVPVVLVPVAFVSEHSETLVELDVAYRELAERNGVPRYVRAPTVGTTPSFIDGLASLVRAAAGQSPRVAPVDGHRLCPGSRRRCGCAA